MATAAKPSVGLGLVKLQSATVVVGPPGILKMMPGPLFVSKLPFFTKLVAAEAGITRAERAMAAGRTLAKPEADTLSRR